MSLRSVAVSRSSAFFVLDELPNVVGGQYEPTKSYELKEMGYHRV